MYLFHRVSLAVRLEEESQMPDGSEFQTAGAATLKPREAKVADNRKGVWHYTNVF